LANNNYQAAKVQQAGLGINVPSLASMKNQTLQGTISGGSNTINLGNLILAAQGSSFNLFDDHIKKYEVYELPVDILLLSATLHRMKSNPTQILGMRLTDKQVLESITEQDKEYTKALRDYYSKKFLWWTLNEVHLTNFRQDLKHLINSDGTLIKENIMPLAYKMPEFYEYDMSFDTIMSEHNTVIKSTEQRKVCTKHLTHVRTFYKKRKHMSQYEYWFVDDNDNLNVMIINKDNPLKSLLDLVSSKPIQIDAIFTQKVRDNKQYFVLEKYSFL